MIIEWLQEEVSGIKRLKRESDQALECAELEIHSTMENINSTRDFLSGLISTSKKSEESQKVNTDSHLTKTDFLSDLSKAEKNLENEITLMADKVKVVLLPYFEVIPKVTDEKKLKADLQTFSEQTKNTITNHIDSKSSSLQNEIEKKLNEAISAAATDILNSIKEEKTRVDSKKQVVEQFETKFGEIENKLNLIHDAVKNSQTTTDISDIKTQISELKKCDFMKYCFDFMEKAIGFIKDTEHKNFFSELKKIKSEISNKSPIKISFDDNLFDDEIKAQEEVKAFEEKLKSQCKDLEFS